MYRDITKWASGSLLDQNHARIIRRRIRQWKDIKELIGTAYHVYSFTQTFKNIYITNESQYDRYLYDMETYDKIKEFIIILFPALNKSGNIHFHGYVIYVGDRIASARIAMLVRKFALKYGGIKYQECRIHDFAQMERWCQNYIMTEHNYKGWLQEYPKHTACAIYQIPKPSPSGEGAG